MEKMIKCKKPLIVRINKFSVIHIEYLGKYDDIRILNLYDNNKNYVTCIYTKFQYLKFNYQDEKFISYSIMEKERK